MKCPHCQIDLSREVVAGVELDRCEVCHGLWLDDLELGTVVCSSVPSEITGRLSVTPDRLRSEAIECPKCAAELRQNNYAYDSGITVKKCGRCGGVWLESGQLAQLVAYRTGTPNVRQLAVAMAAEMAASRRLELFRRVTRSKLASGLVALVIVYLVLNSHLRPHRKYRAILGLLLPLACIWFPEHLGRMTGVSLGWLRPRINEPSNADILAVVGWLVLLMPFYVPVIVRLAIWICS
ncbi:MAG: zf-TFIIB domain-containing protein [Pirellulales bacterium]